MPINNYGVWVAKPVRVSAERAKEDPKSPHIHLYYKNQEDDSKEFRASINVKSLFKISELVFWLIPNFQHPIVNKLPDLNRGFQKIESKAGGVALDYIRGNLMDFQEGRILPHDLPEERDDIIDYVMPELESAIERNATIYLFGEPYDDKKGIHNVHMNQGSAREFAKFNGVWQDGGIIIYFPDENRFAAIFLAFASQAIHTDEVKGNALPGSQNFAQLLNTDDVAFKISDQTILASGEMRKIVMKQVPLSNQGGLISLLDDRGNKVDGVSYTREQAQKEGELVIFR